MAERRSAQPGASDDPLDVLSSGFLEAQTGGGPDSPADSSAPETAPGGVARGTVIDGRYEITGLLPGDGRNPEYSAVDNDTQQQVLVRFIPELFEHTEKDDLRRVLQEARACSTVRHPNLVHLLKVEAAQGKVYFIVEVPEGRTAAEVVAGGPMSAAGATKAIREVAEALAAVHKAGLVHRNVSPQNIVLDADGPARLRGLGLTGVLEELQNFRLGVPLAEPKYTPPELFQNGECDHRGDIYALAATWFTLLTGRPPFEADTSMQVLHKHATAPIPDPTAINPAVPTVCRKVLAVAMAKDPAARYRDMPAFIAALGAILKKLAAAPTPQEPGSGLEDIAAAISAPSASIPIGRTGTHAAFSRARSGRTTTTLRPTPAQAGGMSPALVIGGVIAGVLVLIVVLFLALRSKGGKPTPPPVKKQQKTDVLEPPPEDPPGVFLRSSEQSKINIDTVPDPPRTDPPKTEPPKVDPPAVAAAAFRVKINFQLGDQGVPAGYVPDDGSPFGNRRGHSYGWSSDHRDVTRRRNKNADAKLDTICHFHAGAKWEIAVANGAYDVTVCIGDAENASTHTLNVEGNNYWRNHALPVNRFAVSTKTVTVRDGRLTLDQGTAIEKATRIAYVEIAGK